MQNNSKGIIDVIIEPKDGLLWGIVEGKGNFVPTPYGKTKSELINNLKELISNYQKHEGKTDRFWTRINVDKMEFKNQILFTSFLP